MGKRKKLAPEQRAQLRAALSEVQREVQELIQYLQARMQRAPRP